VRKAQWPRPTSKVRRHGRCCASRNDNVKNECECIAGTSTRCELNALIRNKWFSFGNAVSYSASSETGLPAELYHSFGTGVPALKISGSSSPRLVSLKLCKVEGVLLQGVKRLRSASHKHQSPHAAPEMAVAHLNHTNMIFCYASTWRDPANPPNVSPLGSLKASATSSGYCSSPTIHHLSGACQNRSAPEPANDILSSSRLTSATESLRGLRRSCALT
jgi:hypothetical protein